MNKAKKNLAELRSYLQRDTHGMKLLDAVSRDITDQRKRIALLHAEADGAKSHSHRLYEEYCDAQTEIGTLKTALETQTARLNASRAQQRILADRIGELEQAAEVDDEIPVSGTTESVGATIRDVVDLFKSLRKKYKRIPPPFPGRHAFKLEGIVRDFTQDEFMWLGKLVAALALHNLPTMVIAETTIMDMDGWDRKNTAKFAHWCGSWIQVSTTEEKISNATDWCGRTWSGPMTEKGVFGDRRIQ